MSNLHRPDQELLVLLQSCVAGQQIDSMEEARALLLKNFRVGRGNQSACAQWLTEMARDLLAPIPFREVFVILALFLPQLTFVDEAATKKELWYSVLALLLAFATPSRKRKGDEAPSEKLRRLSSPRHWDVALVPFPEDLPSISPLCWEFPAKCPFRIS